MNRTIEGEGRTIDDAIDAAVATLGTTRDAVDVEVLEEASRGFLGVGARMARVRATIRATVRATTGDDGAGAPTGAPHQAVSRETPPPATGAKAAFAREVLTTIVRHIGVDAEVGPGSEQDDGTITFAIHGAEAGLVIGRHGQTLDALEHLLNRIVFRDEGPAGGRVAVDAEGYRERRVDMLQSQARSVVEKVRQSGRSVAMPPMSPRDRRTVHIALGDEPDVTTDSEGEGELRRVVVRPAARGRQPLR